MSSCGLIMMVSGFCISGSTAAVQTGDMGSRHGFESHLKQFFCLIIFLTHIIIVKVTSTELQDMNRMMGYRDV